MSLLRLRCSLTEVPLQCQWVLVNVGREPVAGEGLLAGLPHHAGRVQLIIPAAQVLITRAQLPDSARRHAGSVLAYAVEDQTVGDPDTSLVSRIGSAGDEDVLAVVDKEGLNRWLEALAAAGIGTPEVHCETLLLPWSAGMWSLAWNGREGIVRTGKFEGAATDCGDSRSPPLSLRLLLDEAQERGERPALIEVHAMAQDTAPDLEAWQRELGVVFRLAEPWDWRTAAPQAGASLVQKRPHWRLAPGTLARLRPAAWIVGVALLIQATTLAADWTLLTRQQQTLRNDMVARFRDSFPDAIAVVDPALQMRRKLADARHAAGQSDLGDFLPMIEQVTTATTGLPVGSVRTLSYEKGRMTFELAAVDEASVRRIVQPLLQSGLRVDMSPAPAGGTSTTVVLTVQAL